MCRGKFCSHQFTVRDAVHVVVYGAQFSIAIGRCSLWGSCPGDVLPYSANVLGNQEVLENRHGGRTERREMSRVA